MAYRHLYGEDLYAISKEALSFDRQQMVEALRIVGDREMFLQMLMEGWLHEYPKNTRVYRRLLEMAMDADLDISVLLNRDFVENIYSKPDDYAEKYDQIRPLIVQIIREKGGEHKEELGREREAPEEAGRYDKRRRFGMRRTRVPGRRAPRKSKSRRTPGRRAPRNASGRSKSRRRRGSR